MKHDPNKMWTNWPEFAAMLRRGDPDELRASLPEWMRLEGVMKKDKQPQPTCDWVVIPNDKVLVHCPEKHALFIFANEDAAKLAAASMNGCPGRCRVVTVPVQ